MYLGIMVTHLACIAHKLASLQEVSQIVLSSLLQHQNCMHLEAQIVLPISLWYLPDQAHKGPLTDEEFSTLLVLAYLMESHSPWPVPQGPL